MTNKNIAMGLIFAGFLIGAGIGIEMKSFGPVFISVGIALFSVVFFAYLHPTIKKY